MKKILFVVCISLITSSSFSQASQSLLYKKKPSLSVNFMMNDFRTANLIKGSSVSAVLRDKSWSTGKQMSPGLSVSYFQGITNNIDFMASLGGSFADFAYKNKTSSTSISRFLMEIDADVNFKLLSDKYAVDPFLTTGVGATMYNSSFGAYIPFGLGIQFKLSPESFLFTTAQYRVGITEKTSNHFNYAIGFAAPLFGTDK